jgi:hypothetical protein
MFRADEGIEDETEMTGSAGKYCRLLTCWPGLCVQVHPQRLFLRAAGQV